MHRVGVTALALSLVTGLGGIAAASAAPSAATTSTRASSRSTTPVTRRREAADDVAGIKAQLVQADLDAQAAAVTAEQAAERYNGARCALQQARRDARVADRHARIAVGGRPARRARVRRDRGHVVRDGSVAQPALRAAGQRRGLPSSWTRCPRCRTPRPRWTTPTTPTPRPRRWPGSPATRPTPPAPRPRTWPPRRSSARDAATSAAAAADQASQDIAARKNHLIHRLAQLQHISVSLAQQRQAGIERAAREAAQRAAEKKARQEAAQQAARAGRSSRPQQSAEPRHLAVTQSSDPTPEPSGPTGRHPPRPIRRLRRRARPVRSRSPAARSATPTSGAPPARTPGTAPD